ncbi:MAG: helix-turn-helix domain-containing protein [Leptospirillia bacterium]
MDQPVAPEAGPEPRILSLQEAADLMGIPPKSLREKARLGKVPAFKLGRQWRFIQDDLIMFCRSLYGQDTNKNRYLEWPSGNASTASTSPISAPRTDAEYAAALGLGKRPKPRNTTTG